MKPPYDAAARAFVVFKTTCPTCKHVDSAVTDRALVFAAVAHDDAVHPGQPKPGFRSEIVRLLISDPPEFARA